MLTDGMVRNAGGRSQVMTLNLHCSLTSCASRSSERLERALVLAAYIVLQHGMVYAPYIDRLEKELEAARRNDPVERAKRILETYTVDGGRNTIRSSHSRLCSSDGPTP
jgi:hypothetical protein